MPQEEQILSQELKEDKKLKLSVKDFYKELGIFLSPEELKNDDGSIGVEHIIYKSLEKISDPKFEKLSKEEKRIEWLKQSAPYPNNYVLVSFAERSYFERKRVIKDKPNKENIHGEKVLGEWILLTGAYHNLPGIWNAVKSVSETVLHRTLGGLVGNPSGYFGAAYWNPYMQQIIIVHRGTANLLDGEVDSVDCIINADVNGILLNQHIGQIDSAITFTDKIINTIKKVNEVKGFNIQLSITGHSLGAWLAPITAFSAKYLEKRDDKFVASKNYEKTEYHTSTVIFDGAGCKSMLERIQDKLINRSSSSFIDSLDITNYLSTPNTINACNNQVGDLYRIFIDLSEKDKSFIQKAGYFDITRLAYTLGVMHKIDKIKNVFDSETGEVFKDKDGNLRIQKVVDWPLLLSENPNTKFLEKMSNSAAAQLVLALLPAKDLAWQTLGLTVSFAIKTGLISKAIKWHFESSPELNDFFKLANAANDFNLDGKSTRVKIGENYYRTVRYETEKLDKDYKNRRKLNVFTQSDGQFLKEYKVLQEHGDKLPSTFKPEQLFKDFDEGLKSKTIKLLRECEVKDGAVYSSNLPEFIPYIKRMLHFFPEMKNETKEACQKFSANVLCGIYQSASLSYLKSLDKSLDLKSDTFGLETFLAGGNLKILHTVQSNTSLGAIIVSNTLKKVKNCYRGNNDHVFLNLDRVFYLGEELFISFLKKINHKYLLVVECNDVLNDKMKEFFKDLFKALKENHNIKVILVTEKGSDLSRHISECVENNPSKCQNIEVKFSDLTSDSQEKLLEKAVIFQGKEVPLSRIVNGSDSLDTIIDPETVVELFNDKKIEIGKTLPSLGQTEDYYIDRKLVKKVKVEKGVFKDENLTDLFAVSNVNKEELLKLTNGKRVRNFGEEDPDSSNPIRFITLNKNAEENNFKNLCGVYSDCTIHWLKRENNGDLIWQRSHGKTLFGLRRYIENYESDLSEDKYSADNTSIKLVDVDDISTFDEKFIVVAAEPGMGKTTALTRLGTQRTDDSKWLIRINLVEYKDELEQRNFSAEGSIVEFLHENNIVSNTLEEKLLESRLNNSGNIVFLLDGFDEITSEGQKNVISLLKKLQETKVEKVLISTRLHLRNELENSLSTVAYTFKPFFPGEQKQFLKKFWQKARNANVTQECLDNYINKLLKFVSESIGDKERKFMGIPMQMRMVAEAFQDMTKDRTLLDHPECIFPENFDMVKLYDRFIDAKYRIYAEKIGVNVDFNKVQKVLFTEGLNKIHMRLAIRILFPELAIRILFPEMEEDFVDKKLPSEEEEQEMRSVGIIQSTNDEITFTHRTFAEHFVASFLADRLNKNKGSKKYETTIAFLAKELFESKNEVIKTFLDYRLAKKSVERRIIYAAFRGKLDDVKKVLSEGNTDINATDALGRSALHYTAQEGNKDVVNALINNGADIRKPDGLGKTALHYAARYNYGTQVVSCLLENALENVEDCINKKDKNGRNAVHYAAQQGNWGIVDFLIKKGADTRVLDQKALIFHYIYQNNLKLVKTLIEQGADVIAQDNHGNTLLHIAAQKGHLTIIDFLLEKGADVGIANNSGKRPISYAAESKHWNIVESLLRNNASFNDLSDTQKLLLLGHSAQNAHWKIVKLFMKDNNRDNYFNQLKGQQKVELLCHVIFIGDFNLVEFLMKKDIEINDFDGIRPVYYAARNEYWNIVESLLRRDAKLRDLSDEQKLSLLDYSTQHMHWDVVRLFIADDNRDNYFDHLNDKQKMRCLYYFISVGDLDTTRFFVEKLIEKGKISDVNTPNNYGKTFLHLATQDGKLNIAQYLIEERGANLNAITNCESTPLHLAARNGHLDTVEYLIDKIAGFEVDHKLHWAAEKGHTKLVKLLAEKVDDFIVKDSTGSTPLHLAALSGDLDTVKYLINDKKVDFNVKDDDDWTPLHLAALSGDLDTVKYLIEVKNADFNAKSSDGWSPLHGAAKNGHLDTVKYLVEIKADFNAKSNSGGTPLHFAAQAGHLAVVEKFVTCICDKDKSPLHWAAERDYIALVKRLVENGAQVDARDNNDKTPLHFAVQKGYSESVKYLLAKGADILARNNHDTVLHLAVSSNKEEVIKLILNKIQETQGSISQHINVQDTEGDTPLMWAAECGRINAAQILLEYGANSNVENNIGMKALHWAALCGHKDFIEYFLSIGVNVDNTDGNGWTPLHYAAWKGQLEIVNFLISKGANVNAEDKNGKTPLYFAVSGASTHLEQAYGETTNIQSSQEQQKVFLHLFKFTSHHFPHVTVESVKQGLYLPSFAERRISMNGKCVAITRGLSQVLFLQSNLHKLFLHNLKTSAELYERLVQGKQISKREERGIFALSKLFDTFEQQLDSSMSSLPSNLTHIKSYKTFGELSDYIAGIKGNFAIHLVTSNHVVAIYKKGDTYSYFDTNVAFVSGLKDINQLMEIVERAVKFASYKLRENGFLIEHFDVNKANSLLSDEDKQVLTKEIKTERQLLAEQDKELGPIKINGQELSRVQLYDFGTKVNIEGGVPLLINADMNLNSEDFLDYLNAGKVNITAREYKEYLDNLGGDKVKEVTQATKIIPFIGSKREIKDAEQTRKLGLSKLLKFSLEQSIILDAKSLFFTFQNISATNSRTTASVTNVSRSEGQVQETTGKADSRPETHFNGITVNDQLQTNLIFFSR